MAFEFELGKLQNKMQEIFDKAEDEDEIRSIKDQIECMVEECEEEWKDHIGEYYKAKDDIKSQYYNSLY